MSPPDRYEPVPRHPTRSDLDLEDLGFVLAALLALVLLVPAQLASIILFDSTGLDVLAPDMVFVAVVPALAVAAFPTLVARRLYSGRTTRATAAVAFAASALLATYAGQFYGMCGGPGC